MVRSRTFLFVHFMWATWDRQPLISAEMEPRLYACMAQNCEAPQCKMIIIDGTQDHVHTLIRMRPTACPADVAKELKGASYHLANHVLVPGGSFNWQGSYGAFSVGQEAVEAVCSHIRSQKQRHLENNLRPDWERCYIAKDDLDCNE